MRKNVLLIPAIATILTLTTLATSARALPSELQSPPQPALSATSDEFFYYFQGKRVYLSPIDGMIGLEFDDQLSSTDKRRLVAEADRNTSIVQNVDLSSSPMSLVELRPAGSNANPTSLVDSLRALPGVHHVSLAFKARGTSIMIPRQFVFAKMRTGVDRELVVQTARDAGLEVVRSWEWDDRILEMKVIDGYSLEIANRLYETGLFEFAEPDFMFVRQIWRASDSGRRRDSRQRALSASGGDIRLES